MRKNGSTWPKPDFDKHYDAARKFVSEALVDQRKRMDDKKTNKPQQYDLATHRGFRSLLIMEVTAINAITELLRKRIEELEARPELKHCGVWKEGKAYKPSNLVTHNGGLWLASKGTKQRPGQSAAWTLVVKSGAA